jgi:hypothetical protein
VSIDETKEVTPEMSAKIDIHAFDGAGLTRALALAAGTTNNVLIARNRATREQNFFTTILH